MLHVMLIFKCNYFDSLYSPDRIVNGSVFDMNYFYSQHIGRILVIGVALPSGSSKSNNEGISDF